MFKLQTADMERIVLSTKYIDELRAAPESLLSVREGMCEVKTLHFVMQSDITQEETQIKIMQRHLGRYTTLDVIKTSHLQNEVCRVQLTQNLRMLIIHTTLLILRSHWSELFIEIFICVNRSNYSPNAGGGQLLDLSTGS